MSIKNGKDYLYLVWKSGQSGQQYIVGKLTKNSCYVFRYCDEVKNAIEDQRPYRRGTQSASMP